MFNFSPAQIRQQRTADAITRSGNSHILSILTYCPSEENSLKYSVVPKTIKPPWHPWTWSESQLVHRSTTLVTRWDQGHLKKERKYILSNTKHVAVRVAGQKSQLRRENTGTPKILKVINRFQLVNHKSVSNAVIFDIRHVWFSRSRLL